MKMYKITQKMLGYLEDWKANYHLDATTREYAHFVNGQDLTELPFSVRSWKNEPINPIERNERMIAIIQWLNGKNVFEVEKPHMFIVRNVGRNQGDSMVYLIKISKFNQINIPVYRNARVANARKFNTREEAELWTTNGYEVVEIDGDDHVLPFQ